MIINFLKNLFSKAKDLFSEGGEILDKVENMKNIATEKPQEEEKPKVKKKTTQAKPKARKKKDEN